MSKLLRNDDLLAEIGARVKALRLFLGMNQTQFAKQLGTGQSAVGNWETGKRVPDTMIIIKMTSLAPITTDWLLTGSTAGMTQAFIHEFFGSMSSSSSPPKKNGTE